MVYLYVAAGAVLAGFVQGLSGFAFGLVAMSVWAWGLEPQLAGLLSLSGALTGQIIAAVTIRRGFSLRLLWPFLAGGLLGVPLGVWLVPRLDLVLLKLGLGTLLVVWAPAMLFSSRLPTFHRIGRAGDSVAGAIGGVMGGVGGFAGAIPTLWCTVRAFPRDEQRTVIQNFNLTTLAVAFAIHAATGNVSTEMLPMMAIVAAAALVPVLLGARLYLGISEQTFRRIVLVLLTLSGIAMLTAAIPAMLTR